MSDSTPQTSVVISTYNRAQRLRRAVNSVLTQTLDDFELIIVDNASMDQTPEVARGFNDPRVRYIRHERNKGGSAARNTGIKSARGRFIALLDDDDEWFPQKLEKQIRKIQQVPAQIGLIYVGSEIFDEDKQKIVGVNHPKFRGQVYERLLLSTIIGSVSSALIRKECFDQVGLFDEELTSCQDWDMWLRIARRYEFDFLPDILTRINVHGQQISSSYQAMIPGRTRMVEKHLEEFKNHPEVLVVHLKRLGKLHCINGTWKEAWPWFKKAVEVNACEAVKITAWCLLELPYVKYFSAARHFKKYSAGR